MASNKLFPAAPNRLMPDTLDDGSPDPNATEGWQQLYRNLTSPTDWGGVGREYANALLMGSTAPGEAPAGAGVMGRVMENPAFAKWFGQSKLVDAKGNPVVVYHGTTKDFDAFDPKMSGTTTKVDDAKLGGFHFTTDPKVASSFAPLVAENGQVYPASGSNVMPVYLKAENPAIWDFGGGRSNAEDISAAIRDAKSNGHDSLVLQNIRDGGLQSGWGRRSHHVIVFSPNQIKSAIGNRGTFDPSDPRITYGIGALGLGIAAAAGGQDQQ